MHLEKSEGSLLISGLATQIYSEVNPTAFGQICSHVSGNQVTDQIKAEVVHK